MKLTIVNGPNINLIGEREKNIYGTTSFKEYSKKLINLFPLINLSFFQSNIEGELINYLQKSNKNQEGIILNAGAYTHTSLAISDCIAAINIPVIEVHVSNVMDRESIRHLSLISKNCIGVISGFGLDSYQIALNYFNQEIES